MRKSRTMKCMFVSVSVSCLAVSCRVMPCRHSVPYLVVPCRTVSYRIVSYRAVPCRIVPCRTVSCRTVSYRTVSCRAVLCCIEQCNFHYLVHRGLTSIKSSLRPVVPIFIRLVCDFTSGGLSCIKLQNEISQYRTVLQVKVLPHHLERPSSYKQW